MATVPYDQHLGARALVRRVIVSTGWAALPPRLLRAMIGDEPDADAAMALLDSIRRAPERQLEADLFAALLPSMHTKLRGILQGHLAGLGVRYTVDSVTQVCFDQDLFNERLRTGAHVALNRDFDAAFRDHMFRQKPASTVEAPLHVATVSGLPVRFFKPPSDARDFERVPWHCNTDLMTAAGLPPDRVAHNLRCVKRDQPAAHRTVATPDGLVTMGPHWAAGALLGGLIQVGLTTEAVRTGYEAAFAELLGQWAPPSGSNNPRGDAA